MRQLLNVAYSAQVESKIEEGEVDRFHHALYQPPIGADQTRRPDSLVTPQLLELMEEVG